jgi:hypothetical protein
MRHFTHILLAGCTLAVVTACGGDSTGPQAASPVVATISPAKGTVGTELTITGADFRPGATVAVGSFVATDVQIADATTLYAKVPTGVVADQVYGVTVKNSDGTSVSRDAAFTAVAPTLLYMNGATRPSGNSGSTVILEGAGFGDAQGTGQVLFSNGAGGTVPATIASASDWTDGFIVTTVPSGAASGDVKMQTATGTSTALTFTLTTSAQFSPSAISWTGTTALPVGLSGHDAQVATLAGTSGSTNVVYVTGGADSTYAPLADVRFATIQSSGQLGNWTSTAALPTPIAFHASVVATPFNSRVKGTGYIYVLGGATTAAGAPSAAVFRGTLNTDGTVSTWTTLGSLPAALHSLGAVLFRGDLYIVGGSTTANAPVNTVYRARVDSLGALTAWIAQPNLPSARSYHGVVQFGGYLYTVGGESTALTPNDSSVTSGTKLSEVAYAKIDLRTGNLTASGWAVNSSSLSKATSKHTVVAAGGSLLTTAGLYNGATTGSSEQSYAQINSDGTIGSFAGATGAHTIASAGGKNLFNHAALAYTDATGVAHVLVLGGDDVNAPGKKRAEVWFY